MSHSKQTSWSFAAVGPAADLVLADAGRRRTGHEGKAGGQALTIGQGVCSVLRVAGEEGEQTIGAHISQDLLLKL